jgi:hypothetical protein
VLQNVVLVVLGDHGNRDMKGVETSMVAKLEERMPVLGVGPGHAWGGYTPSAFERSSW